MQQLLKDPNPQDFNAAFPDAARDLTQNLGQIHKFTLPDRLNPAALRTRGEASGGSHDRRSRDRTRQEGRELKARDNPADARDGYDADGFDPR